MAFKCSRFKIVPSSSFSNNQAWADDFLNKLKTAFVEASNGQWALYSDIENISGSDNLDYPKRTLQLYNSTTNKYLRFWCFAGERTVSAKSTETPSVNDTLNMYKGNFYRIGDSSYNAVDITGSSDVNVYYGIKSYNSINKDFGYDLQLDVPIFKIAGGIISTSGDYNYYVSRFYSQCEHNTTSIYSVVTNGDMFWIGRLTTSNILNIAIYAPDLYICANTNDEKTEGVIMVSSTGNNFYLGDNNDSGSQQPSQFLMFMFKNKNGEWVHENFVASSSNNKKSIVTTSDSNIMATCSVTVWLEPKSWSTSSGPAITDGICLKGWTNPDYFRSVNVNTLTYPQRGLTFGNGRWICVDAGVLFCWDIGNTSSPFDPYVA